MKLQKITMPCPAVDIGKLITKETETIGQLVLENLAAQ